MTAKAAHKTQGNPDEIQREFWQYRRVWIAIIVILVAGRLLLTHFPLLRGWDQKFAMAALEMGKQDLPGSAIKTNSLDVVNTILRPRLLPDKVTQINDAILVAIWVCKPLNDPGICLKYLRQGDPLTMVISFKPSRFSQKFGPYARAGWGGYYIVEKDFAAAAVGPFDPKDILNDWPYASNFVSQKTAPIKK